MEITEVRIVTASQTASTDKRVLAFAQVAIDDMLVLKDLKLIRTASGGYFVAMPSRKRCDHCPDCGHKTELVASFCAQCGRRLGENRGRIDPDDAHRDLYADVCHPITAAARAIIEDAVIGEYLAAVNVRPKPIRGPLASRVA